MPLYLIKYEPLEGIEDQLDEAFSHPIGNKLKLANGVYLIHQDRDIVSMKVSYDRIREYFRRNITVISLSPALNQHLKIFSLETDTPFQKQAELLLGLHFEDMKKVFLDSDGNPQ